MRVRYEEYIQTEEWRQRAETAKARVGQRCQICNRPAPRVTLEVHHRTYERLGEERPEDLTVLCRGCRDLYVANRRMPRPPQAQSSEPPSQQQALGAQTPLRPAFVPAKQKPQRSTQPTNQSALLLANPVAPVYQLALDPSTDRRKNIYGLMPDQQTPLPEEPRHRVQESRQVGYQPNRSRQIGLAVLVVLLLFVLLAGFDFRPQASLSMLLPDPTRTYQPVVTQTPAPLPTAVPATATPTPTLAPPTPTLAPTPQPATATPADGNANPPVMQQWLVNQTALVCGNPCRCAPLVRTITRGTAVNVLETTQCQSDTWYKIGDGEWLGPHLLEESAVVTTTPP